MSKYLLAIVFLSGVTAIAHAQARTSFEGREPRLNEKGRVIEWVRPSVGLQGSTISTRIGPRRNEKGRIIENRRPAEWEASPSMTATWWKEDTVRRNEKGRVIEWASR